MIEYSVKGDWRKTRGFLERAKEVLKMGELNKYGRMGVKALEENSPRDTGLLASSWRYKIVRGFRKLEIVWYTTDIENNRNVALLVQYGHATKSGTFYKGIDFVNPAMRPVFDEIAKGCWKEVTDSK